MAKKFNKRKYARKGRKGARRTRIPRSVKGGVPEWASLTETKPYSNLPTNTVFNMYNLQLSNFPRAASVAQAYQLYRIKRVKYILSPLQDTFAAGSNTSVPYLYYMIDRTRNLSAVNNPQALKRLGCKPRRIDDKIITFSYRPSVLTASYDAIPPAGQTSNQYTQYKLTPWLATRDQETLSVWNPDTTDHQGIVFCVETSWGAVIQYKMEMMVEFEFKKPSINVTADPTLPPPVELDTVLEPIFPPQA